MFSADKDSLGTLYCEKANVASKKQKHGKSAVTVGVVQPFPGSHN